MSEPERGVAYDFYTPVKDFGTGEFVVSPTIDVGDFRVSKDGGTFVNLATVPVVTPSASRSVKVSLSAAEMDADKIVVEGIDMTTAQEWRDVSAFIDCPASTPGGISKVLDILEGDHIERFDRVIINRKNTNTPVLDKKISGSLLTSNVVIRTTEQP